MSTVSITASPTTSRRRPTLIGDRKSGLELIETQITTTAQNSEALKDLSNSILEKPSRDAIQSRKPLNPNPAKKTARKSVNKPEKTRLQTLASVATKNLVVFLVILGFVQLIRWYAFNSPPRVIDSSDFDGRLAELESSYKRTTKMTQVMIESVDRKIEEEVLKVRSEVEKRIEEKGGEIGEISRELKGLDRRMEGFEKWVGEFSANERLMKEDFERFREEYKREKGLGSGEDVSLDEIRVFAGNVVRKEIEKHAADGLGRVDYALGSGGAMVVRHSEPYGVGKGWTFGSKRNGVHRDADKMLRPSFGEPGQCFPLKGSNGFVEIKLRTAIVPEAVTLEHVAKSVAYDRSSAPKDCRVSGWLRGQDTTAADVPVDSEKMILLTEFTYDLEKSNAQTFNVLEGSADSGNVDTIRLDFSSNHGSLSHTCIYRVRVHGREPNSLSTLPI